MTRLLRVLRSEAGFTLIELLVALTILGIISGVLAGATTLAFRTTGTVTAALTESVDSQSLTRDLLNDVSNATSVTAAAVTATVAGIASEGCDPPDAGDTAWLGTTRDLADGTPVTATYFVTTSTAAGNRGGGQVLERRQCTNGVPGPRTLLAPSLCQLTAAAGGQPTCPSTTLSAPMTSPTGVTLTSHGGFPTSGPYNITVAGDTMTVTGGYGGTTLTVAGGSGALHSAGDHVVVLPVSVLCGAAVACPVPAPATPDVDPVTETTMTLIYGDGSDYSLTTAVSGGGP